MKNLANTIKANLRESKKNWKKIVITAVVGGVLALYSLQLPLLVVGVVLSYVLTGRLIAEKLADSKALQIVIAVFIHSIISQMSIILVWVLNDHNFPLSLTPVITISILLVTLLFSPLRQKQAHHLAIINKADIISSAVVLALVIPMVIAPMRINGGPDSPSSYLALINNSVDDSNHIAMINDRIQFNRGVMLGTTNEYDSRIGNISFYPAGLHSYSALILKAFIPNITPGIEVSFAYIGLKLFWYSLMILIFVRTLLHYGAVFVWKRSNSRLMVMTGIGGYVASYYLFVDMFSIGFYSFFPQVISIILIPFLATQLYQKNSLDKESSLTALFLIAVGGSLSWILLLPAFALSVFAIFIHNLSIGATSIASAAKDGVAKIFNSSKLYWPLILTVVLATLLQVYIMSKAPSSPKFIEAIILGGRISEYNMALLMAITIGAVGFIYTRKDKASQNHTVVFILYLLASLFFAGIIYAILYLNANELRYYFFKSLYAPLIVAIQLAVLAIIASSMWLVRNKGYVQGMGLAALSAGVLLMIITPNASQEPTLEYMRGIRPMTYEDNMSSYKILSENNQGKNFADSYYYLYIDKERTLMNDLSTHIVKSNEKFNVCSDRVMGVINTIPPVKFDEVLDTIQAKCDGAETLTLITDTTSLTTLKNMVKERGLDSWLKVVDIKDVTEK